jgi:RNA polymerase sigma factor (sigma-70 family)
MELAKKIAGSFRAYDEDFASELLLRVVQIKAKRLDAVQNWKAFLATSLYNAAKNALRREDAFRRQAERIELETSAADHELCRPGRHGMGLEESSAMGMDVAKIWSQLSPEMQELAWLFFEEKGNTSSVAKRLQRPRKTVEYWIQKLRRVLKKQLE